MPSICFPLRTFNLALPSISIHVEVVTNEASLGSELVELLCAMPFFKGACIGLGIEFSHDAGVALLQLCVGSQCVIIQPPKFVPVPASLYNFLASDLTFVVVGIKESVRRLYTDYGLVCRNVIELGPLAAAELGKPRLTHCGLLNLCVEVLGCVYPMIASTCPDPWSEDTLIENQIQKAASSAFASFAIGNQLLGGTYYIDPKNRAVV